MKRFLLVFGLSTCFFLMVDFIYGQTLVPSSTSYCEGTNGVTFSVENSLALTTYTLQKQTASVWNDMESIPSVSGGTIFFTGDYLSGNYRLKTFTTVVTITMTHLPENLYNVTGGGAYCSDMTNFPVIGLSGSQSFSSTGIVYKLFKDGNWYNNTQVNGTGGALTFGNIPDAGVYTVRAERSGCQRLMTGSKTITVNPVPEVSITSSVLLPPDNCGSVQFNAQVTYTPPYSGTPFSFDWDFGQNSNPASSAVQNPVCQFPAYGTGNEDFDADLQVTDKNGCVGTANHQVNVLQRPDPLIQPLNGLWSNCNADPQAVFELTLVNKSTTAATNTGYLIEWDDGNSVTLTPAEFPFNGQIVHTYANKGTFNLKITVSGPGPNNCNGIRTYPVFNGSNPSGGIQYEQGSLQGCRPHTITFRLSGAAQTNAPTTFYYFNFGDGTDPLTFTQETMPPLQQDNFYYITHTYNTVSCDEPGRSFTLVHYVENPCSMVPNNVGGIKISEKADAGFLAVEFPDEPIFVCAGVPKIYTNNTSPGCIIYGNDVFEATNYYWDFNNDGTFEVTGENPLYTFSTPGLFPVTQKAYTGENIPGNCGIDEITRDVCVQAIPVAAFTSDNSICTNAIIVPDNTSSGEPECAVLYYQWTITPDIGYAFVQGTHSGSFEPSIQFTLPGVYTLQLTTSVYSGFSACQSATHQQVITVVAPPSVSVTPATLSACGPATVDMSALVTYNANQGLISGYLWNIQPTGPVITNPDDPYPVVTFDGNITQDFILTVAVENQCGTVNSSPFTFMQTQTIADNSINYSGLSELCSGMVLNQQITGTQPTGGTQLYSYRWYIDQGSGWVLINGATGMNLDYNLPLTFNPTRFRRTVESGSCTDESNIVTVTVLPGIQNNTIDEDQVICAGSPALQIDGSLPTSGAGMFDYLWEFSDNDPLFDNWAPAPGLNDGQNYLPGVVSATTRYRRMVFSGACEVASNIVQITVNEIPAVNSPASSTICTNVPLNYAISCSTPGVHYSWTVTDLSGGDITGWSNYAGGPNSNIPDVLINSSTSIKSIQYVIIPTGPLPSSCQGSPFTLTVSVYPRMTSSYQNTIINTGTSTQLNGTINGGTPPYIYSWSPVGMLQQGQNLLPNPQTIVLQSPQTFLLSVTDANNCPFSQNIEITTTGTGLNVDLSCSVPGLIECEGVSVTLTATASGGGGGGNPANYTYTWGGLPTGATHPQPWTAVFVPGATGANHYDITVGDNFSTAFDNITLMINKRPVVTSPTQKQICSGESVNYIPQSDVPGSTFQWERGTNPCIASVQPATTGTGPISNILNNSCATPEIVTYTITPTGPAPTFCLGTPVVLSVEVMPVAAITNPVLSQTVVSGQLTTPVTFTSNVSGASIFWEFSSSGCPSFIGPYLTNGSSPLLPAQILSVLPGGPSTCTLTYKATAYLTLPGGKECWGTPVYYSFIINSEPVKYTIECPLPVCDGNPVQITLNGSDIGVDYQLLKNSLPVVGALSAGTGSPLVWTVNESGTYTILATNISNQQSTLMNGLCQVVINPNPVSNYLIGSTGNCAGDNITLNGSQDGVRYYLYLNATTYTQIFRDGPGPLDFGPQASPGEYTIKATYITSGCTVWIDGSINLLPLPDEFPFTPAGSLCSGDEFSINGSQPGILYSLICTPTVGASFTLGPWMGDGNPINFGPQLEPGIYKVLAYNPLTGCDILMADEKLIWPNPIPYNVTPATPQCGNTTIGIDNSETGFTYRVHRIDPISGNPYNLPDPAFPIQTGNTGQPLIFGSTSVPWTYCVIAFDPNNICTSEMNGRVTVLPTPTQYNIQPTGTLCFNPSVGVEVFLEHSETGVNYTLFMNGAPWSLPVAGVGGTAPLSFGFISVPGTFTIVANHASNICTAVMTGSLTLIPNPAPFIMNPPGNACPGSEIWLSGSQINVNYTLHLPAGQTITKPGDGNTLSWGPMYQPGTYYISAASSVNACIGNMTGTTTIRPNPGVFSLLPPGIHCEPQVLSMQNAEANTTYEILYSNGSSLNPPVTVTPVSAGGFSFGVPLNAGIYIVRAVNLFGCDTLMNGAVTIHAQPTVNAGPADTTICNLPPWSIDLSGTAGNYTSVLWTSPTNPTGSNFSNPNSLLTSYTFTAADLANKTVTLTLKVTGAGGCATSTSQDQITVHILAPIVNAGPDQSACVSQKFTLNGTVAGNTTTGEWSGGAGTFSPNRQTLQAEYTPDISEAGTSVVLTLNSTQADPCPNVSDQITLTIHAPLTSGMATGNQTICYNQVPQPLQATVPSGGSGTFSYQWQQLTGTGWTNLPGETALSFAPPALTTTTEYRIVQSDQNCAPAQSVNSNIVTITVYDILTSGVVLNPQSICVGETPAPLSISIPTGGSGQFTYQWQSQSGALGWMNISGATSTVFAPSALMETTRYRVIQIDTYCSPLQSITSSEVVITVYAPLGGGTVTQDQVICHGSIPASLNVTLPSGGSGSFAQQWQKKSGTADFENIPLATGLSYAPPALTTTTQYRVVHTDIGCNPDQQTYSNTITITVHDQFNAGTAGQDQTICFGETPNPLQITPPSGGSGNFGYQWYKDTGSGWSIITGATTSVYQPLSLTMTTQYRVVQTDNYCQPVQSQTSNTISITVRPQLLTGQLSQAQTICNGERPAALNITPPQGGSSSINLVWQMRTSGNPWITIIGANSNSYWPESLTQTTEYRVLQNDPTCNPLQSVESNIVIITVYSPLVAGTLTADQSQCFGEVPLPLTVTLPAGGSTQYALQWQSKSGTGDWINIPGANATVYNPGALTVSTQFRVLQQDIFCSTPQQVPTNIVTITVHDQLREGTATSDQTICYGHVPNYLTATALQGGTGNYSYQWQSKSGTGNWTNISGGNDLTYLPPALFATTQYRLVQTDEGCVVPQSVYSNEVTITVHPEMIPGIVTANQTICYGEKPVTLTAGVPAGGSGDFTYQWQSKVGAGGWSNIGGANLITFSPPNLTLTTSYRLLQRDVGCFPMQEKITNEITITVHPRLQPGTVLSDQVICHGETPLPINSAPPIGGSGNYELQWQYQTGGTGWFNIPGANALVLSPAALQVTTQYRLVITDLYCNPNQVTNSGTVTITVHGQLIAGAASSDQSICYNTIPQPLQAVSPTGGSTQFTYQWQIQAMSGLWNDIPSANGLTYAPPALTQTTRYRMRTTDGYCNPDHHVFSNEVVISVFGVLGSGTASADQTICRGEAPLALNLGAVSGGSGNFSYQWQVQSAGSGWSNIPGATQAIYSPPALFQTTQYRVVQTDNHCAPGQQVSSNAVTVTVHSTLVSGVAGSNQTICFAETPALLNLSLPGGGSGNFSYQWQYLEAVGDWTDIPGANGRSYQPNPLAEMVKYRVIQTDLFCEPNQQLTSNIVTINVYPQLTPGLANFDQTICYGETPDPLVAQPPSGGSGQFNYNWQVLNGFGNWLNINGATTLTYSPPALFVTTKYRISQIDPYCNPDQSVASVAVTITVHPQLVPGSAGPDQVLCFNEMPVPIAGTLPTGGSGNIGLQWQSKTGSGIWENIPNATGLTYVPGLLPETTQFRLTQTDEFCDPDQFVNTNPVTLTIVPLPQPTVLGPAQVCVNSTGNIYQTQPGKHDYEWTVTGGIVTAGGGINDYTITVTWNILGTGTISVNYRESINDCKATNPFLYQVDVVAPPVPVIVTSPPGNTVGCLDQCVTFETEAGMTSYQWTLSPGGEICALGQPTDRRVVAKWTAAGTHWVSVNYTGAAGCPGNMATVYPITIIPAPTPTITGPNSVCEGGQINTYITESGMNGYQWSVSSGGTIAGGFGSNQINVIWNTTGNHTVTVSYTNIFGCEAVTPTIYPVSVTPLPVPLLLGPVNACLGSTGNVYVTDPGNSAYDWTISAGGVIAAGGGPNDHSVTVQWNTVGAQSVSVNFTSPSGCEAIIPTNLAVFVQPATVPVVNGPATVCQGEPAVSYMTQAGMSGYNWTVSSGGQIISGGGTNAVMVHWFGSGSQTLSVNFTNPTGCTPTAATVKDVTVSERPLANFTSDPICQGTVTTFTNTSTAGGGNFTSYWTFGDGGTSNAASPTHIYSAPGNYTVVLTVTNLAGCSHDTSRVVAVYPKPNALFTNSVSNCAGDSVQFTDLSTTSHGHITDWVWDFGDGTPVASITFPGNPSIKHKFANGGNYNVKLTVTTSDGCEAERISLVTIAVKPLANFAFGSGACANLPLSFTDLSQLNGGPPISAWSWNFGDPGSGTANFSTMQNPMHLFSAGDNYTVKLQITNANGCIDSISKPVVVNPTPIASFSVDSSCIHTATQFHDESTASSGNIVAWLWNFGDPSSGSANTSTLQHPGHVFSAQGIYWVNLQVTTEAQCVKDTSILVTTNPAPIADFQFSTSCEDDLTFFTDLSVAPNSSNKSWEWDFGDGGTANIQHPSYQYQNAGTYQVRLIVTNLFNCRDTVIKPVIVKYKPLANYTYENSFCPGLLVSFQDSSVAYGGAFIQERLWQFGQGATSNISNPQYTFTQGNMYHPVNLIVTDNFGCRDTIYDSVFVKPGYDLTFSYDTACFGAATHFNAINLAAGDTLYSIHWDFGDPASGPNNTSGLKSPVHQFSSTGSFMVRLRAYNSDNCVDSLFRMVSVRKLPQPSFTYSTSVCNDTVRFSDTSKPGFGEINQWQWIWGDASAPAVITPPWDGDTLHKYPGPGNYPLKLIVTNEHGCIDSIQEQITVTCITAGFAQANTFNCSSDSTGFRDLSSPASKIGSWHWNFGDGQTLDYTTQRDTVRHKFTPGSWLVSLTVQNTATPPVSSVYQTNVTIHPAPTAQFSVNPVCLGDSSRFLDLALSNLGTITSREWYYGDGTNQIFTDTVVNPVHFYQKAGKFNTKFVVRTDNNCRDSVVQIVKVNRLPVAMFSGSPPCERHEVEFQDASLKGDTTMAEWRWYFTGQPSGDTLKTETVTQQFNAAGETEIYFKVTDKNGCTDDTLYTGFIIRQTPVSAFTITDNIDGKQGKIRLNNLSQGMMDKGWKWDYETGQSSASSPVITYSDDSRSYTIQLVTWNEANCYDTTKLTYQFIFDNLFVPNAFSPDSYILDIREFKPKGRNLQDYKLMVFNKWGDLVFETNKLDEDGRPVEGWDGNFNGEPLPQDVYVWKIQATFKNNKVWQGSDSGTGASGTMGTVTLIR